MMMGISKKAAFIIDSFNPNGESGTGGAKNLAGLVSRVQRSGVECTVFTRAAVNGTSAVQVGPLYRKRGYVRKLLFSHELWKRRAEFKKFDLIYSQSASSIPFLARMGNEFQIPTLFDCRCSFIRGSWLLNAFHLATLTTRPPRRVVFVDQTSYRDYRRLFPTRSNASRIPVPVAVPNSAPKRVDDTVSRVLFATQLTRQKGFVETVKAVEELWVRGARFRLDIAGNGPLKELANRLALRWPDRVTFHGFVSFDKVQELMRECDLVVQPSYYEGISVTVLEALSLGIPAVATDRGGMKELCDADVIERAEPANVRSLAGAISRLLNDRTRRTHLSQDGWLYVRRHHDASKVFDDYGKVLATLGIPADSRYPL